MAAGNFTMATYFILLLFITTTLPISTLNGTKTSKPQLLDINNFPTGALRTDPAATAAAATDYGHIVHRRPAAVLHPSSVDDIVKLVKLAHDHNNVNNNNNTFTVAARGRSHSVRGQAMAAENGVVVDMMRLRTARYNNNVRVVVVSPRGGRRRRRPYADVGGEALWIDVLDATLRHGVAPASWTDYLHLTVGGTLSNAGIGGQSFRHGPQISNVHEMDVVTGLGQFGIITRARIALHPAPKRVKWVRLLYSDFAAFTKDQERLISDVEVDYLEGSLMLHRGSRPSSFFPTSDVPKITSLVARHRLVYCLELAINSYDDDNDHHDQERLPEGLRYVPGFAYSKDVSYVEFLDRVRSGELSLQSRGLWEVPHPWLNLFVPRTSAVLPEAAAEEEVFYTVGFLHSSGFDGGGWEELEEQNKEIMEFCERSGMGVKQYLAHYATTEEWAKHFGSKWERFRHRKSAFDPMKMLSPGQRIFNS
ncbi:unnamed protein product [Linum tenue]|uniref:cytokinin dehydrogenase n=1 Tax=Linum tenue TaxID=586396 RepID=A0AAV0S869_9ROSI|nr:unnamed protein product [Linum tenue]